MQNLPTGRRGLRAVCSLAATAALALPAFAAAKPVTADLRVEADNRAIVPGTGFVTDSVSVPTDTRPGCDGSGKPINIDGPSAFGIVHRAAQLSPGVRPFSVSDKFSFGAFVCGIAGRQGNDSSYWLYKVDGKSPEVGADQFPLRGGEEVLWYFVDSAKKLNTGDELELIAPARVRPEQKFEVTVNAVSFNGTRHPVAGAVVAGAKGGVTDANGKLAVDAGLGSSLRLRAAHGSDIASRPLRLCVNERLSRCPAKFGERIFGTGSPDLIRGTGGNDAIFGRGRGDRIDVRGGGRDRVRCGSGRDRVRADRGDRISRDCERVIRLRR